MEKKTIVFTVVAVGLILGLMLLQPMMQSPVANTPLALSTPQPTPTPVPYDAPMAVTEKPDSDGFKTLEISTKVLKVRFSERGGDIVSLKLLEHKDKGEPVEMILSPDKDPRAAILYFGYGKGSRPNNDRMEGKILEGEGATIVEFSGTYAAAGGKPFDLIKRYTFPRNEYLFKLELIFDGGDSIPSFALNGFSYTLQTSQQIGPQADRIDGNYEYRHFLSYSTASGFKGIDPNKNDFPADVSWAAVTGKYFAMILKPGFTRNASGSENFVRGYAYEFANYKTSYGMPISTLTIARPELTSNRTEDSYYMYVGPKTAGVLSAYNDQGANYFGRGGEKFEQVIEGGGWLGWLEDIFKFFLVFFYSLIPNYGVAIILLTILLRAILFPLTFKSSKSTRRMQELNPKVNSLREKYKDDPKRLNAEIMELYRKEKANPLSGCLPMLLQLPLFFAMYNLFNNHFDLRGAMFVPGWIPDLSVGDTVLSLGFQIPILGWSELRLLPFIYVGSQLLYSKFTQTPNASTGQMKFLTLGLPLIFFFILYNAPSGLVLYWIASNALTIAQQAYINHLLKKKEGHND
jgi:YidC/Oxa1 family membrane protein insertase